MSGIAIQQKIDSLSAAFVRGDIIDADLNVTSKTSWKWRIIKVLNCLLQPFFVCFGKDAFQHYRSNNVAQALLKLCKQSPDLSLTLRAKVVTHVLAPLDAKTKGRYTTDVEKVKAGVLGNSPLLAQRKGMVQNALNGFAYRLHQALSANSERSICFAPVSLAPILGMILKAMPEERKTLFLQNLGLQDLSEPLVHLAISELMTDISKANGDVCSIRVANAFVAPANAEIHPEYREAVKGGYGAEGFAVSEDLERAAQTINEWVAEKTEGRVQNLVTANDLSPTDPSNTFFAMLNGVYFSGKWSTPFNDAVNEQFNFALGGPRQVKMMSLKENLPVYEGDTFRMIEIPYRSPEGHHLTHMVFLPDEGQPLRLLEARLSPNFVADIRAHAQKHVYDVKMPKLNVNVKDLTLMDTMQQIGCPMRGNLPHLGNQAELKKVIHQAKVQVDEQGTVALAATAAIGEVKSIAAPPVPNQIRTFHINREYMYMIWDGTKVLFQGNVRDPSALVTS